MKPETTIYVTKYKWGIYKGGQNWLKWLIWYHMHTLLKIQQDNIPTNLNIDCNLYSIHLSISLQTQLNCRFEHNQGKKPVQGTKMII